MNFGTVLISYNSMLCSSGVSSKDYTIFVYYSGDCCSRLHCLRYRKALICKEGIPRTRSTKYEVYLQLSLS